MIKSYILKISRCAVYKNIKNFKKSNFDYHLCHQNSESKWRIPGIEKSDTRDWKNEYQGPTGGSHACYRSKLILFINYNQIVGNII